jgi:hypothetical protein
MPLCSVLLGGDFGHRRVQVDWFTAGPPGRC